MEQRSLFGLSEHLEKLDTRKNPVLRVIPDVSRCVLRQAAGEGALFARTSCVPAPESALPGGLIPLRRRAHGR